MNCLMILVLAAAQDNPPATPQTPPPPSAGQPASQAPAPPAPQDSLLKTLVESISIGGQIRLRYEYRDPTSYANSLAATRTDDLFLTRIRLNFDFKVNSDIEVFIQPQDERQWGQELTVLTDERNLDLHQGYVELRNLFSEPLSLKAGRMELSYGDQRLVSPLDWSNIGRASDGAKLRYAPDDWWIEGFFTVIRDPLAPPPPAVFSPAPTAANGASEDQDFMGVYFSYVGVASHEFDLYGFFRSIRDGSAVDEEGATGDLIDRTVGARVKGAQAGFDYTAEAMSQTGKIVTDRVLAYAYAATLGYTAEMAWRPRLGVEYTFASGDRHPGDGRHSTFDPLYPFGHYYQGFEDIFAFKNGKDLAFYFKVQPRENLSLNVDFHNFWLASEGDAWYNASGAAIRPASPTSTTHVGEELDVHARWAPNKFLKFWVGVSNFFAGPFVKQTATVGSQTDMLWAFAQMTVDF